MTSYELGSMSLKSEIVEVNLVRLKVMGDVGAVKAVKLWARGRRVKLLPRWAPWLSLGVTLLAFGLVNWITNFRTIYDALTTSSPGVVLQAYSLAATLSLFVGAAGVATPLFLQGRRSIILPMTLTEYRQLENLNRYPRAAWVVSILSALIAVGAVVAPIIVSILVR